MNITGIEKLEFGVEDPAMCEKFMLDFGLQPLTTPGESGIPTFATLSGAQVVIYPQNSSALPSAFEPGSTLRRMTWGVGTKQDLAALVDPPLGSQTSHNWGSLSAVIPMA